MTSVIEWVLGSALRRGGCVRNDGSMLTVCAQPGCPELVERGRCAKHARRVSARPWRRLVAQVIERDHGICGLCGGPGATSADHIVRARDGGTDEPSNLRAAHLSCNQLRG